MKFSFEVAVACLVAVAFMNIRSVASSISCNVDADCAVNGTIQPVPGLVCLKYLSTCATGKCECPPGKYKMNVPGTNSHKCGIARKVGESCDNDKHFCSSGTMTCSSNVCACPTGQKPTDSQYSCTSKKNYKEACSSNLECEDSGRLICASSVCDCEATKDWNSATGKCQDKMVGSTCSSVSDCGQNANLCQGGKCACDSASKKEVTAFMLGVIYKLCLPNSATLNVAENAACLVGFDANAKICASPMLCTSCNAAQATNEAGVCTKADNLPIDPALKPKSGAPARYDGLVAMAMGCAVAVNLFL